MTVKKYLMPLLVVFALFATVGVAQAAGAWITSGKQLVENKAQLTPDDVRGWMTIQQVADGVRIPVATVRELSGIPAGSPITNETPLKELEAQVPGFEVSVLRDRLKAHLAGNPTTAPAPAPTPQPPVSSGPTAPPPASTAPATAAPAPPPTPTTTVHVPKGSGGGTGPGRSTTTAG